MGSSVRRIVLLALVGLLVGGVFGFWRARSNQSSDRVPGEYLDQVMPGLCSMRTDLADGKKTDAYNVFWNDVHANAHALVAVLTKTDRAAAAKFAQAKVAVETNLSTLNPALGPAVEKLIPAAREALLAAGRPDPGVCP